MSVSWGTHLKYGDFEIVGAAEGQPRLLGKGSFGKTFEGVRSEMFGGEKIQEYAAIKVIDPALLSEMRNREQFIQELVALSKFKHSNIIHYIRCGEESGEVFCAMELCRGGDLRGLAKRYGPLPERVVALIALQVAAGLREVHQRHHLVHRDLKPTNIMLVDEIGPEVTREYLAFRFEEQESLCRIVDFGLVNLASETADAQQHFVGSPMYASPEQISSKPLDSRSDLYSLGMTLWYLLQAKGPLLKPTGEMVTSLEEAFRRHTCTEEHEPDLPRHLSAPFRKILAQMLAKDPEHRFASAAELQAALREYLSTPLAEDAEDNAYTFPRISDPLDAIFDLEMVLPSRTPQRSYAAVERNSGRRLKLNAMATADSDPEKLEAVAGYLNGLIKLSRDPSFPPTLLPVLEVFLAADMLACTEETYPHASLTDVLRARASAKRSLSFPEAILFLRPLAEALDFILQHGRETIFLSCDEVWLSSEVLDDDPQDPQRLARPLIEWPHLQVRFSMICPPSAHDDGTGDETAESTTISGSAHLSSAALHPVASFVRLIYRTLKGSEVAAAAQFASEAYVSTAALNESANGLLRDLLCRQKPWATVTAVLKELCDLEGIPWNTGPGSVPSPVIAPPPGELEASDDELQETFARKRPAPEPAGPVSAPASEEPTLFSFVGTLGGSIGPAERSITRGANREKLCEIVTPGLVRSPYDPAKSEQVVAPEEWVPKGRVRCRVTQKYFRLPRKLDPLIATVVEPGVIQSPYAAKGAMQRIPWEEWAPGREIVCAEAGKRITLPQDLPLPEAILDPQGGAVFSPYAPETRLEIPQEQWRPAAEVTCPVTQLSFLLPAELPPWRQAPELEDSNSVTRPYTAPPAREPLPKIEREEKREPESDHPSLPGLEETLGPPIQRELPVVASPPALEPSTPAASSALSQPPPLPPLWGKLLNGKGGRLSSPYPPYVEVAVPKDAWRAGGQVTCPATGKAFLLPSPLPPWPAQPQPIRWKLAAVPAVLIVMTLTVWLLGKMLPHSPGKQVTDVPSTVTPGASPTPAPPPAAVLEGGMRISDWKQVGAPKSLQWSSEIGGEKVGGHPKLDLAGNDIFKVSFELPAKAREYRNCVVEFTLPGWAPQKCIFNRAGDGNFSLGERLILTRETAPLSLDIPGNQADYDNILAVWAGHLPEEPEASQPAENSVNLKLVNQTESIPTGIYNLSVTARSNWNNRVRPATWLKAVEVRKGMTPIPFPASVRGEYWGMVRHDGNAGYFITLRIADRLSAVTVEGVLLAKTARPFQPEAVHPYIGDVWKVGETASLVEPGVLRFSCPLLNARTDWTFTVDRQGIAVLRPSLSAENRDTKSLKALLDKHLKESAAEVLNKLDRETAQKTYNADDLKELFANRNYQRLHHFQEIASEEKLRSELEAWKTQVRTTNGAPSGIRLYPLQPLYVQEFPNREWAAVPGH